MDGLGNIGGNLGQLSSWAEGMQGVLTSKYGADAIKSLSKELADMEVPTALSDLQTWKPAIATNALFTSIANDLMTNSVVTAAVGGNTGLPGKDGTDGADATGSGNSNGSASKSPAVTSSASATGSGSAGSSSSKTGSEESESATESSTESATESASEGGAIATAVAPGLALGGFAALLLL